jgi:hypothetical protein
MKKNKTMNRILYLMLGLLAIQGMVQAQGLKEFFTDQNVPLYYYGIDFTRNKVIDDNSASADDIVTRQYTGINELILSESKKYDVKAAYHRSTFDHDLGTVNKRNQSVNASQVMSTSSADFHRLNQDSINNIIKGFDFGSGKGIGLVIVMEALSKSDKAAAAWFTLVDIAGKKVLLTERVEGKTGMGFGFRNYWAAAIKKMIDEVEKKNYKDWKAKYGS